jgi:hypothetical protein
MLENPEKGALPGQELDLQPSRRSIAVQVIKGTAVSVAEF